jgi:hypothetical protein
MTDRRSFIKTLAAGGVLLTFRPLSLLSYQSSPVPGPVAGLAGLADPKDAVWYGERGGVGEKILRNYSSGLEAHYARFAWESLSLNK